MLMDQKDRIIAKNQIEVPKFLPYPEAKWSFHQVSSVTMKRRGRSKSISSLEASSILRFPQLLKSTSTSQSQRHLKRRFKRLRSFTKHFLNLRRERHPGEKLCWREIRSRSSRKICQLDHLVRLTRTKPLLLSTSQRLKI